MSDSIRKRVKRLIMIKCTDGILKNLERRQKYALEAYKSAVEKGDNVKSIRSGAHWELLKTLISDVKQLRV